MILSLEVGSSSSTLSRTEESTETVMHTMSNITVRSSALDVQLYSAFARGDVSLRGSFRITEKALFQATSGQNDECQLAHVLGEGELSGRS
jgi:hypothetical protein